MVLTNVYGIYATIRATAAALRETKGHLVITTQHRRPAGAEGLALLRHQVRRHRHGRGRPAGLQRHRRARPLIAPGMVETPGFSHELEETLTADDIARAVMFAVSQPPHMDINEILIRPTAQDS